MDAPESGGIWTSAIALLSTGGAAAGALWRGVYNLKARVSVVEDATEDHDKKLEKGSERIGKTHTEVQVLVETTKGLGEKIDKIDKGLDKVLDFLLRAKTGTGD